MESEVRRKTFLPLSLLLLFFAGCAHTPRPAPPPDWATPLTLILTSKAPENRALSATEVAAYENQVVYSADDEAIYAALTFHQFKNRHTVQWRWIDPLGQVYLETIPISVGTPSNLYKDVTIFHKIRLKGEAAAQHAGLWQVQAIVDHGGNRFMAEQAFQIDPVLPPPPSPPPASLPPEDPIVIEPPPVEISMKPLPVIEPSVTATFLEPRPPLSLFFGVREAALTPDTKQILIEQIETFKRAKRVLIYGYHDAIGSTSFNLHLAWKRAKNVADFLIAHGVASEGIQIEGKRQVYFAPNDTREGRKQNRRVTLTIEE